MGVALFWGCLFYYGGNFYRREACPIQNGATQWPCLMTTTWPFFDCAAGGNSRVAKLESSRLLDSLLLWVGVDVFINMNNSL